MTCPTPTAPPASPAARVKLTIEYDGTRYCGWQVQPNGPTVQAALEAAWARLTGRAVRLRAAGRTDAGVHARGQVACAPADDLPVPVERLALALNTRLPDDIVVRRAERVDASFDPRRDCVCKRYRYRIATGWIRPGREGPYCWHVRGPLAYGRLARAAVFFEGTHDFTSFAKARGDGHEVDPVRTVERVRWSLRPRRMDPSDPQGDALTPPPATVLTPEGPWPEPSAEGDMVWLDVEGRSFLYNMVRALTGTMVESARGRFAPEDIPSMLAARDRRVGGGSAPARGLCLEWVRYANDPSPSPE